MSSVLVWNVIFHTASLSVHWRVKLCSNFRWSLHFFPNQPIIFEDTVCLYFCSFVYVWEHCVTLYAAPPCIMDLMKMPRSSPVSLDLFPLRLMPRPAEPVSLRGTSNMSCSFPFSETKPVTRDISSFWEWERESNGGRRWRDIDEEEEKRVGGGRETEVSSLGLNSLQKLN